MIGNFHYLVKSGTSYNISIIRNDDKQTEDKLIYNHFYNIEID